MTDGAPRAPARPTPARRAPAWGADLPGSEEQARNRLLDAAERCYAELGVRRTRMSDIADRAGVHRRTVYSYFPSKDAVLEACFMRAEAQAMAAGARCFDTDEPFLTQLANAVLISVRICRESPSMRLLLADDGNRPMHIAARSEAWRARLTKGFGHLLAEAVAAGEVRDDVPVDTLAHWVARIAFSLLAEPGRPQDGGDEGLVHAFLARCLQP
ncbi:bacterial regulatory s, tetR family protein [Mycolicibacterium hassiacum DSM 44199]|jgi:AcrR family transcriptional regulator|uniref:Bacterial regulatory s, tetR family protein n=1 Tax=Mycolicibacterium hassiacum (strain DSM 44199 / CIP 105218 / JCM 12690 / 3849) TaxID=1122247 RepID=K5BHK1_MYCHD|nr:TetR/AcrR family transcriptional regulator [Mycolicibacterium hassiacum]EKF24941.1 bacterial regulatory s, tetR family protein [Mycolicibacterium hassiacum DSM 44199]MBX5486586.1 TetR/AcrR family transcriptional regulator [Mycolicibacterium hassiacum]MDA4088248.1 TetR family transcriptional regulator [Mycolicibacterium hassiacum DSM 44199]PZN24446.1 MAG: TetR/AcrR family transcriptional regulator [Mycolicibacterium hassiacum]VCT88593.1 putative HTH-type transcriptional regulator [Mycoliciba